MLKSYVMTGARALLKQKLHLALNVIGLSVGLAAALMVALYVQFELSYDRFQPGFASTYRIAQIYDDARGREVKETATTIAAASLLVQQIAEKTPEVAAVFNLAPLGPVDGAEVKVGAEYFVQKNLFAATPNIRDFIALEVIQGDLGKALSTPNLIALSRSEAMRFFGGTDVVGKTIEARFGTWTVAAVFEDLPANTHFAFASLAYLDPNARADRFWGNMYLKLADGVDLAALEQKIATQLNAQSTSPWLIGIMPLSELHLKSGNNRKTIGICIALGLLLLCIASFNFINISTAQAARRAKEVGIRKGLGATRGQLVTQFLVESVLVAAAAAIFAAGIVKAVLPWFLRIVEVRMTADLFGPLGIALFAATLIVGLLAGVYPALFISSFSARRVLSGDLKGGKTGRKVRNSLLFVQSMFAVCLIVGTVVVFQQIRHLNDMPVGYERSHRLEVRGFNPRQLFDPKNTSILDRLRRVPGVIDVAAFDRALTDGPGSVMDIIFPKFPDTRSPAGFSAAGFGFTSAVGVELVAGRDFSTDHPSDWYHTDDRGIERASIVITESMSRSAGYATPDEAIGQQFKLGINGAKNDFITTVVGVVRDVKIGSAKEQQYPIFFICGYSWARQSTVTLHIENRQLPVIRREISDIMRDQFQVNLPDIRLVNDNYEAIYQYERRQAELVLVFACLAIFLTCIGLFGLAAMSTQQRTREIAVRKSLGASVLSLVNLISREYMLLIALSLVIAFPVAFYFTNEWLSHFNERVQQSVLTYVAAGALTAAVAWLTVAGLATRAASVRPSITLRHD